MVLHCLTIFTMIYGLSINLSKSTVTRIGMDGEGANLVASELQCRIGSLLMKYLGLPIDGRLIDSSSWEHVLELFKVRLAKWKSKHLSIGGRLTLIKSVLSSIPIYVLSVRLLQVGIHNKLHSIMSNFLWEGLG